jgi:hypothetical protein
LAEKVSPILTVDNLLITPIKLEIEFAETFVVEDNVFNALT